METTTTATTAIAIELDAFLQRHLWLRDDGVLLVEVGPVWGASHIASLAELRALYNRENITVSVFDADARDSVARRAWLDPRVDLIVSRPDALAYGALRDDDSREELYSGLTVRPLEGCWEVVVPACPPRREPDWAAVVASGDDISWVEEA